MGARQVLTATNVLLLAASAALGQDPAALPAFEVASVKPSAPLPPGVIAIRMGGGPDSTDPGRINYEGVTLRPLIAKAYGLREYQVEGPEWLDSDRYDVVATIPPGSDKKQIGLMMQRLLVERFHLKVHHESKPLPVYTLSVAKDGAKLKEADPAASATAEPPPPKTSASGGSAPAGRGMPPGALRLMFGTGTRHLNGSLTLARLCDLLTNFLDRPVVDLTDLKGTYQFDLSWIADENERIAGKLQMATMSFGSAPSGGASSNESKAPPPDGAADPGLTLVQALQVNYGLKLEPKRNPADVVVVDRAENVPTEN